MKENPSIPFAWTNLRSHRDHISVTSCQKEPYLEVRASQHEIKVEINKLAIL